MDAIMTPREYGARVTGTHPGYSAPPVDDLAALLVAAGIVPVSPVVECRDARRRSKTGTSWLVVLPKGTKIPMDLWAKFEDGAFREGNILIVELRKVG